MNTNSNIIMKPTDIQIGWHELYRGGIEGVPVWSELPPPFMDKLIRYLPPGTATLETCCGDGRITAALVKWSVNVTALDLSPSALNQLAANIKRSGMLEPTTVAGSVTAMPFGDAQFDAVVCIDGFCQLDRPVLAMKEVARVLRPGGRFLVDIFTPKDETFGKGEQMGAQDFLYHNTLFRYFTAEQFAGIYKSLFRTIEMFEEKWRDPPHGDFRPEWHNHHALIYVFEKL